MDHVAKDNHVIDWAGAKILDRASHQKTRQLREFIHIHKEVNCMNRDGGAYSLPTTYDRVFWSRVHQQRHVTTCLTKFAVGERNVAKFCVMVV